MSLGTLTAERSVDEVCAVSVGTDSLQLESVSVEHYSDISASPELTMTGVALATATVYKSVHSAPMVYSQ